MYEKKLMPSDGQGNALFAAIKAWKVEEDGDYQDEKSEAKRPGVRVYRVRPRAWGKSLGKNFRYYSSCPVRIGGWNRLLQT